MVRLGKIAGFMLRLIQLIKKIAHPRDFFDELIN